ncbi:DUF748 domain-containing protein [uncultured Nevskia sp.]|uniref:DUF748 domain-containing protein n=1 Tax=uncultured Nevskia sp. TaxID=228950 RepID=UPI0025FDF3C1|nr:DUF748 domain-containing protein [uncultured Nevskia sp.]
MNPPRTAERRWFHVRHWRWKRRWSYWLAIVIVVGIAARVALPYAMKGWLNQRLASLGNYQGHVEDVHVALWRGSYELQGVHIQQLNSAVDEPLFATPVMEIQVLWFALMKGTVVARIRALKPTISFAAGHRDKAAQTGKGVNWADLLDQLTPFRIDRLEIISGQVHYYDLYSKPKVDVHLDDVEAVLTNLTNAGEKQGDRVADLQLEALAMAQSKLTLDLQIDPFALQPDFALKMKLLGLQVARMRPAMQAYTPFDPTEGKLDVILEATGKDGGVEGYVKPLFTDLKVVDWKQEMKGEHNPFELAVNAVGSVLNLVLQNQAKDQLATKMPFSGRLDAPNVEVSTSVINLLKNAFVSAFEPRFERQANPDKP